ncbi:hypothetical protein HMPREF1979_03048 [Actinomyces johnsonii F0542]|uniref:Uncharacterized protein n=1 Tax=Actinomyces johnsonii F0542 TaxID=1321818 RepID=U1RT81_9ACTO|nr:hypothetical protein HMPREF1979_03048 [Actinomyces johnsonii F0542]
MGSSFPKQGAHNCLTSNGHLIIVCSKAAMTGRREGRVRVSSA